MNIVITTYKVSDKPITVSINGDLVCATNWKINLKWVAGIIEAIAKADEELNR